MPNNRTELPRDHWKWVVIVSIAIAVFFIFSVLLAKKDEKLLLYSVESTTPVSMPTTSSPGLTVPGAKHPNRPLTLTNIRLWNAGQKTIRCNDIYYQRLSIYVPEGVQVLSCSPIKETGINAEPILQNVVQPGGRRIFVEFDYLTRFIHQASLLSGSWDKS